MRAQNNAKALECFTEALKDHPTSWQILQNIGSCHMELGNYNKAIEFLQRSIEVGGLHQSQCNNMAALYQRLGQPQKALAWLKLACSIEPALTTDPNTQAALERLQDPENNPKGCPTAPDYFSSLAYAGRWHKESMPLKVFVRRNIQLPSFYAEFTEIVRASLDQWCAAAGGVISYKLVSNADAADIICDYTDHRDLVSSRHELGIDGITEMLTKLDQSPGPTNIVVLVKDDPASAHFRMKELVEECCLHEVGHALGMHGHSPNSHDIMFPGLIRDRRATLSNRDKSTIRRIYHL